MDIYVNNESLNFELSQVIPLKEVLNHVQEWAVKKDLYILDYKTPNTKVETTDYTLSSEISRLDIELGTQKELVFDNLVELNSYLDTMGSHLATLCQSSQSEIILSDKADGLMWICDSFISLQPYFLTDSVLDNEDELLKAVNYIKEIDKLKQISVTDTINLVAALGSLKLSTSQWIKSFEVAQIKQEDISIYVEKIKKECKNIGLSLDKIATNLTIGKQAEAILELEKIIEFLSDSVAIFSRLPNKKALCQKIIDVMSSLMLSLDNADLINAADIVDFDIKDLLAEIKKS